MYFAGHDDCYFYVESRSDALSRPILCRLLALLAGSALVDGEGEVVVPEPLAADLLAHSSTWSGKPTATHGGEVTIVLSPIAWRLGQQIPDHPTHAALFDASSGDWNLTYHDDG